MSKPVSVIAYKKDGGWGVRLRFWHDRPITELDKVIITHIGGIYDTVDDAYKKGDQLLDMYEQVYGSKYSRTYGVDDGQTDVV